MAIRKTPLPIPLNQYDVPNESLTRKVIKDAFNQHEVEITAAKTQGDKEGSLAMRRFQFLLMGAS